MYQSYKNYTTYRLAIYFQSRLKQEYVEQLAKILIKNDSSRAIELMADLLSADCYAEVTGYIESSYGLSSVYLDIAHTALIDVDWLEIASRVIDAYNRKTRKTPQPPPPSNMLRGIP